MRKSTIDAPVLIKRPTNNNEITLQEGNLLKIKCQADGNPIPKIDWYLNGTKIDKSTYKDIQIEIKGNLSTLIIGKVGTRHEGNFSCIAHNNNGLLSKWAYVSASIVLTNIGQTLQSTMLLNSSTDMTRSLYNVCGITPITCKLINEIRTQSNRIMKNYTMDTTIRSSTSVYFCSQETCVYGSCIRENNTSFCRCLPPYSGIRCEYQPPEKVNFTEPCITFQNNKDHSFTENKLFALISFSLLLVLVLLLIILLCFYKFRKRRSYIHGIKAKKLKNAATQVSDIFYSDLNISQIPDNISSSILNTEKSFLSSCVYNEAPPYNSLVIQKDSRGPPSGQSCSSQDTSLTNTVVIPKSILLSVNDNSYSLYNSSTMNNNYCHTQLPPQMIRLENTSPYLCPALETETNLSLNNYIGNIISLPFSCNDPCCCLNVDSKNLLTPTLQNNVSKPSLISIHSNPMESDHICTCKCNIQSINTFV